MFIAISVLNESIGTPVGCASVLPAALLALAKAEKVTEVLMPWGAWQDLPAVSLRLQKCTDLCLTCPIFQNYVVRD